MTFTFKDVESLIIPASKQSKEQKQTLVILKNVVNNYPGEKEKYRVLEQKFLRAQQMEGDYLHLKSNLKIELDELDDPVVYVEEEETEDNDEE